MNERKFELLLFAALRERAAVSGCKRDPSAVAIQAMKIMESVVDLVEMEKAYKNAKEEYNNGEVI